MAAKNHGEPANVFAQTDPAAFDQAMFKPANAASDLPDPRIVAHLTALDTIWADARQPRRAVPASIRMHWNGSPEDVGDLLGQWHLVACKRAGVDLSIGDVLMGRGEGIDAPEDAPVIFREYVALLRLAQSIYADGLINPISVIEQRGRFLIESGERRWLAYHLLHLNGVTGEWGKIPAVRSDGRDFVWRQAQENTARRQLNAIGMARQLALLIMETRAHLDGVRYDEFEDTVLNGVCDRRFYAQVANGNIHRIPKGMGERIQGAMGLSMAQLSQYRRLLKLTEDEQVNDALWVRADVEDWPELALRQVADTLTIVKVRDMVLGTEWTLEDLRRLATVAPAPRPTVPGPSFLPHDRVMTRGGFFGTVIGQSGDLVTVRTDNDQRARPHHAETLELIDRKQSPAPPPVDEDANVWKYEVGEAVQIQKTDEIGEVQAVYRSVNGRELALLVGTTQVTVLASEVFSLGMSYREFIEDEIEQPGVTFDEPDEEDEDADDGFYDPKKPASPEIKPPAHGVAVQRVSSYYDQSPAPSTDKADSAAPVRFDLNAPIITRDHGERLLLQYWQALAVHFEDEKTQRVLQEIMTITPQGARQLVANETIEGVLSEYYDHLYRTVLGWMEGPFSEALHRIEAVAREE